MQNAQIRLPNKVRRNESFRRRFCGVELVLISCTEIKNFLLIFLWNIVSYVLFGLFVYLNFNHKISPNNQAINFMRSFVEVNRKASLTEQKKKKTLNFQNRHTSRCWNLETLAPSTNAPNKLRTIVPKMRQHFVHQSMIARTLVFSTDQ